MRALLATLVASVALLTDPVSALGAEIDVPSPPRSGDPWIDDYADAAVREIEYAHWLIHWAVGDPDPATIATDFANSTEAYAGALAASGEAWLRWAPTLRNCIEPLTPGGSNDWSTPRARGWRLLLGHMMEGWVPPPADWCATRG